MYATSAARRGEQGAALIEFVLTLPFLVVLLLGITEYGHYFWVSVNAVEAAQIGLAATVAQNAASPAATCTDSKVTASSTGTLAVGRSAALQYFTDNASTLKKYATVTVTCLSTPVNGVTLPTPSWQIVVKMDFPPAIGSRLPWMKASTTLSGGVTYSTPALIRTL